MVINNNKQKKLLEKHISPLLLLDPQILGKAKECSSMDVHGVSSKGEENTLFTLREI